MSVRSSLAGFAAAGSLITLLAACTGETPVSRPAEATVTATATETSIVTVTPKPSASRTSASPTPTPKPTTTPALPFDRATSGMLVHNEDGSEYTVQIKLGPILTNAKTGMKAGKFKLGDVCPFNPATDAVMQYALMIASNTKGTTAVWNLEVRPSTGKGTFPIRSELFATNTGNLNCVGGDQFIYQNGGSFSPSDSRQVYGYLIIRGYKTAAHPRTTLANSPLLLKVSGSVLGHSRDIGSKMPNGFYPLKLG
jgi:hypothetical protein